MKILALYVENFGTLQQFSLTLQDGKNTLLRPNGWGKSSLAVFVKAMLYGMPVSTRRSLIENERKRYTPWQGGTFGGSMDVQLSSRRVRIERTFGAKESEDTLTLIDLDSGVELPIDPTLTLGEAWFGVDAAAYERSTYISQRPTDESDGSLSIHAKLNRLADATDDIAGYDHAMELLEKQRKYYTVSGGRRGAIADDEEALAQLETQMADCRAHLAAANAEEAHLEQLLAALQSCKKQSATLLAMEQELLRQGEKQAKQQALRRMQTQLEQAVAEHATLLDSLGGRVPDEQTLDTLTRLEQEITMAASLAQQLELRCAPEQPLGQELTELLAYFGDHVPKDADLQQLRQAAELAKNAKLQLQSETTKMNTPDITPDDSKEDAAFPDARQWQRFFAQYPVQKAQADKRALDLERTCEEGTTTVSQLQRSSKRRKVAVLAAVILGLVVGEVLSFLEPIAGIAALVLGLGATCVCLVLWRKAEARCNEARAALQEALAEQQDCMKEVAQLQAQWQAACERIREVLGITVSDVETVQSAIDDYEARRAQAAARRHQQQAAREQGQMRLAALRQNAAQAQQFLQQLWAWGVCPQVEEAPIAVERLAQKAARCEQLQAELAAALREKQALGERLLAMRENKAALLQGCVGVPAVGAATWLRERGEQALRLQKNCEQYRRELAEFAAQNQLDVNASVSADEATPQDSVALQEQRNALDEQEQSLHGQIARCRREIEMHTTQGAPLELLENEAGELRARLTQEKAALDTILSAQKYLKTAKEQFSGRYLERMKTGFARYLSRLCGEENVSVTMDGNFAVKLRRAGVSRTPEAMSTGWRDMISLCARLSLVDALFEEETPFLVLDDPFVNLDDEVAARASVLLDEAASRYQVLYLTCHSSRA